MKSYDEQRAELFRRMPLLKLFTILGMMKWTENKFGEPDRKLRMAHPLSWVWFFLVLVSSIICLIPSAVKDVVEVVKEETVFW